MGFRRTPIDFGDTPIDQGGTPIVLRAVPPAFSDFPPGVGAVRIPVGAVRRALGITRNAALAAWKRDPGVRKSLRPPRRRIRALPIGSGEAPIEMGRISFRKGGFPSGWARPPSRWGRRPSGWGWLLSGWGRSHPDGDEPLGDARSGAGALVRSESGEPAFGARSRLVGVNPT